MKVEVTAYRGVIVVTTNKPDEAQGGWVPIGPGRIGCVICDTKANLGISEEALILLEGIRRGGDDLGDVDWWKCDDGTVAFSWIGGPCRLIHPEKAETGRDFRMFREACAIIPNETPEEARDMIDTIIGCADVMES